MSYRKPKAPKHQNKTAYKVQFDPLAVQIHKKVSLELLCDRCLKQMEWKLQFNKYKKMSETRSCLVCSLKVVCRSYMKWCDDCARQTGKCVKCGVDRSATNLAGNSDDDSDQQPHKVEPKHVPDNVAERQMNQYILTLKERSRRTVRRLFEKKQITWSSEHQCFIDKEANKFERVQIRRCFVQESNKQNDKEEGEASEDDDFGSEQSDNSQVVLKDEQPKPPKEHKNDDSDDFEDEDEDDYLSVQSEQGEQQNKQQGKKEQKKSKEGAQQ